MSNWRKVGDWLKDNATDGAALVGSLLTGNVAGAVAAGIGMVSSATGGDKPSEVLARLQNDPSTVIRLKEIALEEQKSIREHIETIERLKIEDAQLEHSETQKTIRAGDQSSDEKIRLVRPAMAKQSWLATIAYCIGCFAVQAINERIIFDILIAATLSAPAWAYLGLRTIDKARGGK